MQKTKKTELVFGQLENCIKQTMLVVITFSPPASDTLLLLACKGSTRRHLRFSENSEECLFQECNSKNTVTEKPGRSRENRRLTLTLKLRSYKNGMSWLHRGSKGLGVREKQ